VAKKTAVANDPLGRTRWGFLARSLSKIAICDIKLVSGAVMAGESLIPLERVERSILILRRHRRRKGYLKRFLWKWMSRQTISHRRSIR
jgi:hypothetical protein